MKKQKLYGMILLLIMGVNWLALAQEKNLTIVVKRNNDKSVDILYDKKLPGSYYIKLDLINLTNCISNGYKGTVSGYSGTLLRLKPNQNDNHINFSYNYSFILGNPTAKPDSLFTYTLPFKKGKKVKVEEASNLGEKYFGSEKPLNWKSYYVKLTAPDTVCAMRKGTVIRIVDEYDSDAGLGKVYTNKQNYVLVEHGDGTYANYSGLNKNSIFVKLGETVYPQSNIALVEKFDDGMYKLNFSIYSMYFVNFDKGSETFSTYKSPLKYITPYFLTSEGIDTLENRNEYTAEINEMVLFEEFSKRDKKKYIKNGNLIN